MGSLGFGSDDTMTGGTCFPNGDSSAPRLIFNVDGRTQAIFPQQTKPAEDVTMKDALSSPIINPDGRAKAIFPRASRRHRLNEVGDKALISQEEERGVRQKSGR
jgi:hypothetical protein